MYKKEAFDLLDKAVGALYDAALFTYFTDKESEEIMSFHLNISEFMNKKDSKDKDL